MTPSPETICGLRTAIDEGGLRPAELAERAIARSNGNAGRNTYLWQDRAWTLAEAARAEAMAASGRPGALRGLPVSVKDLFDLAGAPTSLGVRYYRDRNGQAARDSWLVERLRSAGAVITGKTHLHPLAWGITGENPEFGDCVEPGNPAALTGGSSSGAVASVLEGSAVAAVGTDTGGSIRVPASLAGLAGYRASLGRGDWRGAGQLAPSFDTMGWLFRDLEDAPLLCQPFAPAEPGPQPPFTRFALAASPLLEDCDPAIAASLDELTGELRELGLAGGTLDAGWWEGSFELFSRIQAWEAARVHAGRFDRFAPSLRERLERGARIGDGEIRSLRGQHAEFRARMDRALLEHELLLLPAAPVASLAAGADHSRIRRRLLGYTTPFSLAGVPVVTVPLTAGGAQLAARHGRDEALLELARRLGEQRRTRGRDRS